MARIRSIKPEFWTSEQVVACSRDARLLFVGMWNHCDDGGVHPASTKRLKMEVLPGDDITCAEIQRLIDELSSNGLIAEFTSQGQSYWYVTGWLRHQKIDRPSYRYPKYEDRDQDVRRSFDEHSSSVDPRSGMEWKGVEGKGPECASSNHRRGEPEPEEPVPTAGAFKELSEADLSQASKVLSWLERQQSKPKPVVARSDANRINVVAAAIKASQTKNARNRVAVFAGIVSQALWENLSAQHVEAANCAIKRHDSQGRPPPSACITALAEKFKPKS